MITNITTATLTDLHREVRRLDRQATDRDASWSLRQDARVRCDEVGAVYIARLRAVCAAVAVANGIEIPAVPALPSPICE